MFKTQKLGKTERVSFSKIEEVLPLPNLLEIQKSSYEWFLKEGLNEVLRDVSPITDYSNNLVIEFIDYKLDDHPKYPVEEWHGGKVHKIRPSVIHLMRGQIYNIDGIRFFTFGGATSHDIDGGILEPDDPDFKKKRKELNKGILPYRINHISWWAQELPSEEEMEEGRRNLATHNNAVDFIVTHCCSSSTQALLSGGLYKPDMLTKYLEEIKQRTKYKKWFFGHYHDNRNMNAEEILMYEQIIRIA